MNKANLRNLFLAVRTGKITPDEAVARLRHMPFEDLGFAKVDHHRCLRNGMPEVILGQGKTPEQVASIFAHLAEQGGNVLSTRSTPEQFAAMARSVPRRSTRKRPAPLSCGGTARSTAKARSSWFQQAPATSPLPRRPWSPPR